MFYSPSSWSLGDQKEKQNRYKVMHRGKKPASSLLFDQDHKLIYASFGDSVIRVLNFILFIYLILIERLGIQIMMR